MIDRDTIAKSKAWPIVEATALVRRVERRPPEKGFVLFETGYGPSGLPHIGTFAEVFRTTLVRRAFGRLSDLPTRLYCFSDDMDGLRKVPDNVPNADMVRGHLGKPLTSIPDPFGTHDSYGAHMNARLMAFLDSFGFDYDFKSATACYQEGAFDAVLQRVLERHEAICEIVRPILGPERRATYSPFLPISPTTGRVLQEGLKEVRPETGTVVFRDEDGALKETPVTGGRCKLQWRADWALRWTALDVDYEMSGKDLIDSVKLASQICRAMGGIPPQSLTYELFLDAEGHKISKSKGNGLTIDDWLRYGTQESLMLFLYREPKAAKRLHVDVIPKHVDEYKGFLEAYPMQDDDRRLGNPVWHIHDGDPPPPHQKLDYGMLLNLASVVNAEAPEMLWRYLEATMPGTNPSSDPELAGLVGKAVAYYGDEVKPNKRYRAPSETERAALVELAHFLEGIDPATPAEDIQNGVYEVGKRHDFANLRDWFKALYEVLLGQETGPRMGSFIAIYGVLNTLRLIRRVLERGTLAADAA
ncbi:MAG: lysine--tRNA ligase [Geminicoccaceae bacterium]|nr:lysine--tRNA ligase [Geminicoccaceae bacterium]